MQGEGLLGAVGVLRHSWDEDENEEWWFQNYVRDCTRIDAKHASPQVIGLGKCLGSGARGTWNAYPPPTPHCPHTHTHTPPP